MKPAPFEYVRPETLDEALHELALDPDESKVLAGGQSLVPMMNFRLARPAKLVDINRIPGLAGITAQADRVSVAARTRHITMQNLDLPGPLGDLLRAAAAHIGHLPIRTRGSFGGSLAHCDASSEWCLVATLLDAEMTVVSQARGPRVIPARDFFLSVFTTAIEPDEILTAISLPALDDSWRAGIAEFARRTGDFAIVGAMCAVRVDEGVVAQARVCLGGVHEIPVRIPAAEQVLAGERLTSDLMAAAAQVAAEEIDPPSDSHGDAEYRRDLVRALLPRTIDLSGTKVG